MEKKRVVVLGGGISGLTAAYALQKRYDVVVIEKKAKVGGVMRATQRENFFFEYGPRTFRTKSSPRLLQLAEELGLQNQIIGSNPNARIRYILWKQHLHAVPTSLREFFVSSLCKGMGKELLREWRQPTGEQEESVYDFAARRLGINVADRFVDPLGLGVFGCEAQKLSVQSAFPKLKEWETRYGSITMGALCNLFRRREKKKSGIREPLFSFQRGTPTLLEAIQQRLGDRIHVDEEVLEIEKGKELIIKTQLRTYHADYVISALPPGVLGKLLKTIAPISAQALLSIPYTAITIVHVGYKKKILPMSGFGYLVPTREKEKLLGVVFDSEIFPQHNQGNQTRLTLMLPGCCGVQTMEMAMSVLKRHLNIHISPDFVEIIENEQALPRMELGHKDKLEQLRKQLREQIPQLHLVGNYIRGPSVETCIAQAQETVATF